MFNTHRPQAVATSVTTWCMRTFTPMRSRAAYLVRVLAALSGFFLSHTARNAWLPRHPAGPGVPMPRGRPTAGVLVSTRCARHHARVFLASVFVFLPFSRQTPNCKPSSRGNCQRRGMGQRHGGEDRGEAWSQDREWDQGMQRAHVGEDLSTTISARISNSDKGVITFIGEY